MTADLLPAHEAADLVAHEETVERGLSTFLDVGRALLAIRDQRLYRTTHVTFDLYVEERWPGLGRSHAYRLLDAARVADAMSPIGDTPANEAQARELTPLLDQPERLRETWRQVNEQTGGKPTAAAIRSVVRPESAALVKVATTTEEFVAQRDTGEVLSVEKWQAVQEYAEGGDDLRRARHVHTFGKLAVQTGEGLPLLDVSLLASDIAAAPFAEDLFDQAIRLRRRLNDWFDALEAARPRGLRVVEAR